MTTSEYEFVIRCTVDIISGPSEEQLAWDAECMRLAGARSGRKWNDAFWKAFLGDQYEPPPPCQHEWKRRSPGCVLLSEPKGMWMICTKCGDIDTVPWDGT